MPRNPDGSGSDPRIHPKTAAAIEYLLADATITQAQAAERAGMGPTALSGALRKPHVKAYIHKRCSAEIGGEIVIRSTRRLRSLVDATSEAVGADVSKTVLRSEGLITADDRGTGGGGSSGPLVALVLAPGLAPELIAQLQAAIGAPHVQTIDVTPQRVDAPALPAVARVRAKGAPRPAADPRGPGGVDP